jgi:hypothetical protein
MFRWAGHVASMNIKHPYILIGNFLRNELTGKKYAYVELLHQIRLKGLDLEEWNFMSYATLCVMESSRLAPFSKTTAD